jgi:hypothetical protein
VLGQGLERPPASDSETCPKLIGYSYIFTHHGYHIIDFLFTTMSVVMLISIDLMEVVVVIDFCFAFLQDGMDCGSGL